VQIDDGEAREQGDDARDVDQRVADQELLGHVAVGIGIENERNADRDQNGADQTCQKYRTLHVPVPSPA
jgi:hypothetical protein